MLDSPLFPHSIQNSVQMYNQQGVMSLHWGPMQRVIWACWSHQPLQETGGQGERRQWWGASPAPGGQLPSGNVSNERAGLFIVLASPWGWSLGLRSRSGVLRTLKLCFMLSRLGLNTGPKQGSNGCNGGCARSLRETQFEGPGSGSGHCWSLVESGGGGHKRREVYFPVVIGS